MLVNKGIAASAVFAVALTLGVSEAQAATKQTIGGTVCESVYNVNSVYGASVGYQYGAINNRSSSRWGYIDCPIDRTNGYSSGSISDLEISVTDTDGDMWCTAIVRDRYGEMVGSKTVNSSGTGKRVLDFGAVPGGAPYEGFANVFCVLPKQGGAIHSISVDFN